MGFGFKNIGHFFSVVAQDIVKGARASATVLQQVQKAAPEIEGITGLIYPQAVELERGAFALLGMAADAVQKAGDAAAANGVNLQLDSATIAAIKALIPGIEAYAGSIGAIKPQTKP
jgi:hypothetical protein